MIDSSESNSHGKNAVNFQREGIHKMNFATMRQRGDILAGISSLPCIGVLFVKTILFFTLCPGHKVEGI
jgi:hypothetical protein